MCPLLSTTLRYAGPVIFSAYSSPCQRLESAKNCGQPVFRLGCQRVGLVGQRGLKVIEGRFKLPGNGPFLDDLVEVYLGLVGIA